MVSKDKDLDLDFDDVIGGTTVPPVEKQSPTKAPPKEEKKPLGITLTFKTDQPGVYLYKDLAECTGEEFVEWAEWVYPVKQGEMDPRVYDNYTEKKKALDKIMKFHQSAFLSSKIDDKLIH